jgi:hypothetical protein
MAAPFSLYGIKEMVPGCCGIWMRESRTARG